MCTKLADSFQYNGRPLGQNEFNEFMPKLTWLLRDYREIRNHEGIVIPEDDYLK